ncbi:hypothetical protein BN1723_010379 [Verticillium longisporum]|uniref:Uncharacterized protein n=1 Tax=Verticillium longisporum TaxID=100787 RepID=A0A0G4KXQ8_VERLO|nr:hypothetical protein BN1723_010379 [Verticillium longisporum]
MSLESKKSGPPAPPLSPSEQDKTNTDDPAISDLDDVVEKANEKDE